MLTDNCHRVKDKSHCIYTNVDWDHLITQFIQLKKKKTKQTSTMQWHGLLYILFYKTILSLTMMLCFEHVYFFRCCCHLLLPFLKSSLSFYLESMTAIWMWTETLHPMFSSNLNGKTLAITYVFSFKWFLKWQMKKKQHNNIYLNMLCVL